MLYNMFLGSFTAKGTKGVREGHKMGNFRGRG